MNKTLVDLKIEMSDSGNGISRLEATFGIKKDYRDVTGLSDDKASELILPLKTAWETFVEGTATALAGKGLVRIKELDIDQKFLDLLDELIAYMDEKESEEHQK